MNVGRFWLLCFLAINSPVAGQPPGFDGGPLVCGFGEQACRGRFGASCFRPAQGQSCADGIVCGFGEQACLGRYGGSCYRPSQGQTCSQGLICGSGEQICARHGRARCYRPASGEKCS